MSVPLLAGCSIREPVGLPFPRPEAAPNVAIGRSSEADIVAVYGAPVRRSEQASTAAADPKQAASFRPSTDATLTFQSGDKVVIAYAQPYEMRLRTVTFRFHNGILAGYAFSSGFPEDTTPLAMDAAAAALARPDASQASLTAAIGPPRSRQTFIGSGATGPTEFATWNGAVRSPAGRVLRTETVTVVFAADGHVLRHSSSDVAAAL